MTGRYRMWDGAHPVEVDVPVSGGEDVMVPVIRAVVRHVNEPHRILVQRRDDPSENVRGMLEIPGGRWRAGESPVEAITREVAEETGVTLLTVEGVSIDPVDDHKAIASIRPMVIAAGVDGAFPAVHVVLRALGEGEPRPEAGESADVRWWHFEDLVESLERSRDEFIPSSYAALQAYVEGVGSDDTW